MHYDLGMVHAYGDIFYAAYSEMHCYITTVSVTKYFHFALILILQVEKRKKR